MLDLARNLPDAMGRSWAVQALPCEVKTSRLHRGPLAKKHMHLSDTCDVHMCSSFGKRQWTASHTKGSKKVCGRKGTRKEKERAETSYARMGVGALSGGVCDLKRVYPIVRLCPSGKETRWCGAVWMVCQCIVADGQMGIKE